MKYLLIDDMSNSCPLMIIAIIKAALIARTNSTINYVRCNAVHALSEMDAKMWWETRRLLVHIYDTLHDILYLIS